MLVRRLKKKSGKPDSIENARFFRGGKRDGLRNREGRAKRAQRASEASEFAREAPKAPMKGQKGVCFFFLSVGPTRGISFNKVDKF